ncbi:oligosaccharide flippase family protein [Hyunsoonleella pacifica]|uniref:Lipopolysaccharide biosynthesis protein n=1 Tax=Hyunsoonleella pacifica TaxID=1080224 RepID=A0A4Q9FQM7_9FLAO|nr:polysaccharide biosynthesis C-terminal domain-containing protein [Hyunsoonleella pacifica]TBN17634.1 lipopolysaccharide biosynthesis protein [Hyunsoonleella pacifica]GGD10264.1 polysaccharide biosynthesis protein [Hyunsoonleella pacifica]
MGIVVSQSLKNIISTYIGFAIGAINTLFLYTNFMSDTYYGIVGFVLSAAYVMMPLAAFGVYNTLVKFYSQFKTRTSLNSFLTLMLFLPLVVIIPLASIGYCGYDVIAGFLSTENPEIKDYFWHIVIVASALAYFEVFYAWVKVHLQTVLGNFMKEVFHRVGTMMLLFALYLGFIQVNQFITGLVVVYVLRMLAMMIYAFNVYPPVITFKKVNNLKSILNYSLLIIIAGLVATQLLDIDKVMLGKFIHAKNIAYYNVAVFIAAVIAVPQRAMHQILLPMSAKYLNEKDIDSLADLYKRSSLNLFIIGGLVFLLIVLNINQLYYLIADEYRVGLYVVLLISVSRLYDTLLGSNNAILFNSDYYKVVLVMGIVIVFLMVLLNIILIPIYGLNGAALATFIAVCLYNTSKVYFVYKAFKIIPFTIKTLKSAAVLFFMAIAFYFWDFGFHPVLNIVLKSILVTIVFSLVVYKLNLSEDIKILVDKVLKK